METQDAHSGDVNPLDYKKVLDQLKPITDTGHILNLVKEYLKGSPDRVVEDSILCIGVFLRLFTNMAKAANGQTLSVKEVETMFMGESTMLELNNEWYNRMKPILHPIIVDCKISLLTAYQLVNRPDELHHETDEDLRWALLLNTWDFIPWFIFTATADLKKYISAKEMFKRMVVLSKDELIK